MKAFFRKAALVAGICLLAGACSFTLPGTTVNNGVKSTKDIHTIKHVIVIMQEARSFDSYFGTYPGVDGIPMNNGTPTVCMPDPRGSCIKPYLNSTDINYGGPSNNAAFQTSLNGGKMDGFILADDLGGGICSNPADHKCGSNPQDVMGYQDSTTIPNYWAYAQNYVLLDHMFSAAAGGSLPNHLFMVSGWSAHCATSDPSTCRDDVQAPPVDTAQGPHPNYSWTDVTNIMHQDNVNWKYYYGAGGSEAFCGANDTQTCILNPGTASGQVRAWSPLSTFVDVSNNGQTGNVVDASNYFADAKSGRLPAVSWVVPSLANSERPAASIAAGQAWVTTVINAAMLSPDWSSTAIFLTWSDSGGFYDNLVPPHVDQNGYGFRVPGLIISPYAKKGAIDHQVVSGDAILKFIEDDFLKGQRLDPKTDGRVDSRPTVRESVTQLGDLSTDFDFTQLARPPMLLAAHPGASGASVLPLPLSAPPEALPAPSPTSRVQNTSSPSPSASPKASPSPKPTTSPTPVTITVGPSPSPTPCGIVCLSPSPSPSP